MITNNKDNLLFENIFTTILIQGGVNSISQSIKHSVNKINILEIGSGSGTRFIFFTNNLKEKNYFHVDINLQRIKIGRKLNPNFIFICADLEKLPFKNSSFDLILSYSVLHYVEWKILIKNISKILRCKGEVLLIENLSGHPLVSLYRFILKLSVKKYLPFMNPKEYIKTKDLKLFNEYFQCRFSFHHLLTPIALIKPILLKRKEQPLKLQSNAIFNRLWNIDKFLLKFQIFKRFSWFVSIHGIKT